MDLESWCAFLILDRSDRQPIAAREGQRQISLRCICKVVVCKLRNCRLQHVFGQPAQEMPFETAVRAGCPNMKKTQNDTSKFCSL